MKKIGSVLAFLAATMVATAGYGQAEGILVNTDHFTSRDMLQFSQHNYGFTTARAAAMGGAFTSLGGDLAVISMNPAGLGMSRSSIYGFTPSVTTSKYTSPYSNTTSGNTRFTFNNVGAVLNMYNSSRGLISFNMGVSYNKLADYNYSGSVRIPGNDFSISDMFALQLNGLYRGWGGIEKGDLDNNPFQDEDIYPDEWGAVLGYQTGLVSAANNNAGNDLYRRSRNTQGMTSEPTMRFDSRGSTGEFNLAGGFNISNMLYLGFGITVQDMFQTIDYTLTEQYDGVATSTDYLRDMRYTQRVTARGTGLNFKFGAVVRPVAGLRIGMAVHTPTFTSLRREYSASINTRYIGETTGNTKSSILGYYDYSYNSPTRLLFGASYTFGNIAAISVDYDKVFYNGMRLTSGDFDYREGYKLDIQRSFRASDNLRVGVEVKPIPTVSLRAGYAYYGSALRKHADGSEIIQSRLVNTKTQNISAGLGFRLGRRATMDVAYVYSMYDYAPYELYYYEGEGRVADVNGGEPPFPVFGNPDEGDAFPVLSTSDNINNRDAPIRHNRHTVSMSFNFFF